MRFRLLGPIEVVCEDRSPQIVRPRQRAVLAYLLLSANRLVSTEALIDAVWGAVAPSTARAQIHADLSAIRRAFRVAGLSEVISTKRVGYRIEVQPGQLDLDDFTELVAWAKAALAGNDAEGAARWLEQALALWRGPALAGVAADYAQAARAGLEELRLSASDDLAEAHLQLGRNAEVIAAMTPILHQHPLRQSSYGLLMLALYREGRQADALAAVRDLRRALAEQHGLDPGERILELETRILRADPILNLATQAAPTLPLAAGLLTPAQLPQAVTDFVGREDLLQQMTDIAFGCAERPAATVLALTGIGGVGKTALALHWAHAWRDRFPDGQLYINMHGYSRTSARTSLDALGQLLRALGVPPNRVPLETEEASAAYRTRVAGRKMLVLLDNCIDSQQLRPLLAGHRDCLTIITSRDRLSGLAARDGVARLIVDVLTPAASRLLLTNIVGRSRAQAEPESTEELAHLCGYLPLALRIAGTRLADQPQRMIGEGVHQLRAAGNRLAGLGIEGDHQASVAATFELSYLYLTKPTQRAFRLLGLIPGTDFTAQTAAVLADLPVDQAALALSRLVATHLIDETGPDRYSFHDLVRLYAHGLATAEDSSDERTSALARLLNFHLAAATAAVMLLYPQMLRLASRADAADLHRLTFDDRAAALAWLDSERANLVAAVLHAAQEGPWEVAWSLADALRSYFFATGYMVEWSAVARAGLAAAGLGGDPAAQTAAHMSLAGLHWRQGHHDDALRHHHAALELAEAAGWPEAQAGTLGNIGTVFAERGDFDKAISYVGKALAINETLGWREGQAVNHLNLGLLNRLTGSFAEAGEHYQLAKRLYRDLKSVSGEAICGTNLGEMLLAMGLLDEAQRVLEEAQGLHRSVGDRAGEAETMRCLAGVKRERGSLAEALRLAQKAVALAREARHARFETEATSTIASIRYRMGQHEAATGDWLEALRLARQNDNQFAEAEIMISLAETLWTLDYRGQAVAYADEAQALAQHYGYTTLEERTIALRTRLGMAQP